MSGTGPEFDAESELAGALAAADAPAELVATVADLRARGTDVNHLTRILASYARHRDWDQGFEAALAGEDRFGALRERVAALLADGAGRNDVCLRLEAFHLQLMSQERDTDDDIVLAVLDDLVGF